MYSLLYDFFFIHYMSDFCFLMDAFVLLLDWRAPQKNACSVMLYGVLFLISLNKVMCDSVFQWYTYNRTSASVCLSLKW